MILYLNIKDINEGDFVQIFGDGLDMKGYVSLVDLDVDEYAYLVVCDVDSQDDTEVLLEYDSEDGTILAGPEIYLLP